MGLLQAMLNYETNDPLIMSCVLTNISSLFPFATRRQQFLPRVFYKVSHQQLKDVAEYCSLLFLTQIV